MKKLSFLIILLTILLGNFAFAIENNTPTQNSKDFLHTIKFKKHTEIPDEILIRTLFDNYNKYTNNKNLDNFLALHDSSYCSSDGYNKEKLKELAIESWKEYPKVRYSIKVLMVNVDIDNATVITSERLNGITNTTVDFVKGNGFIDSESTSIYYLKKFSNEWRIISDFVVNEKTSMRFGIAKLIPMTIDAPALVAPNTEYTAVLKANIPKEYVALISLNNEQITFPQIKSTEVFRGMKSNGIKERILISNNDNKNENAIASIGIAKPSIKNDNINISLLGMAFLSSRVNVIDKKIPNNTEIANQTINNKEIKEVATK